MNAEIITSAILLMLTIFGIYLLIMKIDAEHSRRKVESEMAWLDLQREWENGRLS